MLRICNISFKEYKYIEDLIIKYLTNSISKKELDDLGKLIENSNSDEIFNIYTKINYSLNHTMKNYNSDKVKAELIGKIRNDKKKRKLNIYKKYSKYAAVLLVLINICYFSYYKNPVSILETANSDIVHDINSEEIILELEDGKTMVVKPNGDSNLKNNLGQVYGIQKKWCIRI